MKTFIPFLLTLICLTSASILRGSLTETKEGNVVTNSRLLAAGTTMGTMPTPIPPRVTPRPTTRAGTPKPTIKRVDTSPAPPINIGPTRIPAIRTCPTPISAAYQNQPNVVRCTTNADCSAVIFKDGPTCCVSPNCICGVQNTGATSVGCVGTSA